jgi:acyl-[acyl-carrier-protein]-phospholipid O-acyltransferase/long-chain-fatty-acid--[acyl-carrier-protein] ligase
MPNAHPPDRLFNRGFLSLLATQFLGAANDNILKGVLTFMVINGAWQGLLGPGGQGLIVIIFNLPFILLSGYAGKFTDRNSKRRVSVLVKVAEIPIAIIGGVGFWTGNLWITLAALVLLCCQSAFFGPTKYGMIPEIVPDKQLSRANGSIAMMTNLAVIAGTYVAGVASDLYDPLPIAGRSTPAPLLWLPAALMVGVAAAGLAAVVFLPRLEPGDRTLKYDWNPFSTYVGSIRAMGFLPLFWVMIAWGYFYFFAGIALMVLPEYTDVLAISREKASLILAAMGITVGIGSAAAGLISGDRIEPRLVPIGAAGLAVFFVLLAVVPPTFKSVCGLVMGAGFFAGFYIIPLQALLQKLSPSNERGRFLGTANAISFSFLSAAGVVYWATRDLFGAQPQRMLLPAAILLIVGAALLLLRVRQYLFPPAATSGCPAKCEVCGYDLTGNVVQRCPECGVLTHMELTDPRAIARAAIQTERSK